MNDNNDMEMKKDAKMCCVFDVIIITAAKTMQANAYENEMHHRQNVGKLSSNAYIMCVADPSGYRIGSGGATLNALYVLSKRIKLKNKKILILHSGGDSRRNPICSVTGKAFSSLPSVHNNNNNNNNDDDGNQLNAPIDYLINKLNVLCRDSDAGGVWICSTDVLLEIPDESMKWYHRGVTGLAIPCTPQIGTHHGVYQVDNEEKVTAFAQKPTYAQQQSMNLIRDDDQVLVDSGIVYLSENVSEMFLQLAYEAPFSGCVTDGHDACEKAFRFELYTDLLCCLTPNTYDEYVRLCTSSSTSSTKRELDARRRLYDLFNQEPFYCCVSKYGEFIHLGTTQEYLNFITKPPDHLRKSYHLVKKAGVFCEYPSAINTSTNSVCVNTILQGYGHVDDYSLVEHSVLTGNFRVETGAIVSGIRSSIGGLHCKQNVVIQEQYLSSTAIQSFMKNHHSIMNDNNNFDHCCVVFVYSIHDNIKASMKVGTFMSMNWDTFLSQHDVAMNDVWPHIDDDDDKTLWNARLYPIYHGKTPPSNVDSTLWMQYHQTSSCTTSMLRWRHSCRVSFEDILKLSDPVSEFKWRHTIEFMLDKHCIINVLLNEEDKSLMNVLRSSTTESQKHELMNVCDMIASSSSSPHIIARTFCVIADILCSFPNTHYYPRAGPARHELWQHSLQLFNNGMVREGVYDMSKLRQSWSSSPSDIIRVARHYDAAAYYLIRQCVKTVAINYVREKTDENHIRHMPYDKVLSVYAPVRIDLAGGWSDTPPICIENGGHVVNVSVKIDDTYPLGATLCRIKKPIIRFIIGSSLKPSIEHDKVCECICLDDFNDYANPQSQNGASLMKCVLLTMGIIHVPGGDTPNYDNNTSLLSLSEQLLHLCNGGIEIRTYSLLPQGTGLGVSSILALAIASVMAKGFSREYTIQSLIHIVLYAEQLLSTGGGYQDQCGAIIGGFKTSSTIRKQLPIQVQCHRINVSNEFINKFNQHSLLVYTGKSRLARDLLHRVIRRWYHRNQDIVDTVHALCTNATSMKAALINGDLVGVSKCLNEYYKQKKAMTSEECTEPTNIRHIIDILRPICHAISLCGAGGGGFMIIITKKSNMKDNVCDLLREYNDITVHNVAIDTNGLEFQT